MSSFSLFDKHRNTYKRRASLVARRRQRSCKRRLRIEPLEQRALLAGDTGWLIPIGDSERVGNLQVEVDDAGDAYVTGKFDGIVDFDPQNTHSGDVDILVGEPPVQQSPNDWFIAKYSASGDFLWVKGWEGDYGFSTLATDASGSVYVTGAFSGAIQLATGVTLTSAGGSDAFVAKLNAADGALQWAGNFSGPENAQSWGIATDNTGVYLTGPFLGAVDFDPGPGEHIFTSAGLNDAYVVKLDSSGELAWATQFDGTGHDQGFDVDVDQSGNVYVTGKFGNLSGQGTTADFGSHTLTSRGGADIFIAKLDSAGTVLWAQRAGAAESFGNEAGFNIAVHDADPDESNWRVYVNGVVSGTVRDFGDQELVGFGGEGLDTDDVFVTQLNTGGDFIWARQLGGNQQDVANSGGIAVDTGGNVYTTGTFRSTADFDPSPTGQRLFTAIRKTIDGEVIDQAHRFVSKLDADGAYVAAWHIQLPLNRGAGTGSLLPIALDNDGGLFLASVFAPTDILPYGMHSVYESGQEGYTALMKINPAQSAIAGSVFFDLDENGLRNFEPGLSGWTVFLDVDGDGQLDAGEPSTTTNLEGEYFLQADPGLYQVALVPQSGWTPTLSPPAQMIDGADPSLFVEGIDLGVFHPHQTVDQLSNDTPLSPPIDGGVVSTMTVSESFQIADLNIEVNLTPKSSNGTLQLRLIGPDGTSVNLFGGTSPTLSGTIFDNEASLYVHEGADPHTGRFRPSVLDGTRQLTADEFLSDFYGKNVQGDWTLEVLWDAPSRGKKASPILESWTITASGITTPGISVTPTSGLQTSEDLGTDSFTVVLSTAPTANVTIDVYSNDTSEGTVSPTQLIFTPGDWHVPQTVVVTGVNDTDTDGDVAYTIVTAPAVSNDPAYSGLDASDVSVTNQDNDAPQAGALYVASSTIDSRTRGRHQDRRMRMVIRQDDGNGFPDGSDADVSGATVTIELRDSSGVVGTDSGTTDASGEFVSKWFRSLDPDTYTVNIVSISFGGEVWSPNAVLDDQDYNDTNGDGIPDFQFAVT